jgi:hypothetical protein
MKMTIFWDVASYSLVEMDRRFRGAQGDGPDDGGSKHPRNVDQLLRDYTTQHPRRQSSSGGNIIMYVW